MLIEKTKPVDQPATEAAFLLVSPKPGRAAPARELLVQCPMPAHQPGLSAAMRHGVAPDIAGVIAITPSVRVPLSSLGLVVPSEDGLVATEERGRASCIDLGAQVGIMLAMEYTAGSRSHRLSNGTFSNVRPFSGDSSVGVRDRGADGDSGSAVGHAVK